MARVGIWLGLFLIGCGGAATPEAQSANDVTETKTSHDDAAPSSKSDDAKSDSDTKSADTKTDDAKTDEGKGTSEDELKTVLQLVIEDAELDKYLRLTEPGRFPLKMAGKDLPSGIALMKSGQPVKIVQGEPAKKDAVLVITKIEIKSPEATVGFRYDIEGIYGTSHLSKASYGWELKSSRIVDHYKSDK